MLTLANREVADMTKIFTKTAVLAAMTAASSVSAQDTVGDWYASVFAGASFLSDYEYEYTDAGSDIEASQEAEPGYIVGVTIGTSFAPSIRAEAEVSYVEYGRGDVTLSGDGYRRTYSGGGDLEATYLLGNVWSDLTPMGGGATPYIGAGLGVVQVDAGGGVDDSTFAYQVGAGAKLAVGTATLDVGYRLKGTGKLGFEVEGEAIDVDPTTSNNLQAALVLTF